MNCADWEERIALYYGGDLAAAEARGVEEHLADCAGCQIFAGGVKETLATLREAHADPIAEAHLTAVRARVMEQVAGERRRWRRGAWACGMFAAAAALLIAGLWPHPTERKAVPRIERPVVAAIPYPAIPPAAPAATHPAAGRVRRRPRRLAAAKVHGMPGRPAAQPLVVKLVTDDPNVVIYWITSKSGE